MSQITVEQKIAIDNWVLFRGEQFVLEERDAKKKEAEALRLRRLTGDYNSDDDDDAEYREDDEMRIAQAWELAKIEAETLDSKDLERLGGEEFKSFIAQDISVLCDRYPHLLLDAQMSLNRQKEDRERKEQKKRKLEESAGGSAGVDASIRAAGASSSAVSMPMLPGETKMMPCSSMMTAMYNTRIQTLVEKNRYLETAVAGWKSDFEFAQARATESRAQNEELKQEIKKLKGQDLNLPADEMDQLIKDQQLYHDRLLKLRVQRELEMRSVETVLEENPDIVCSITGNVFEDPVVAQDGFTYERQAIEKWIRDKIYANRDNQFNRRKWNSPRTGAYFDSNVVFPNIDKKTEIFNAREEATKAREEATSEEGIQRLVEKRRRF